MSLNVAMFPNLSLLKPTGVDRRDDRYRRRDSSPEQARRDFTFIALQELVEKGANLPRKALIESVVSFFVNDEDWVFHTLFYNLHMSENVAEILDELNPPGGDDQVHLLFALLWMKNERNRDAARARAGRAFSKLTNWKNAIEQARRPQPPPPPPPPPVLPPVPPPPLQPPLNPDRDDPDEDIRDPEFDDYNQWLGEQRENELDTVEETTAPGDEGESQLGFSQMPLSESDDD